MPTKSEPFPNGHFHSPINDREALEAHLDVSLSRYSSDLGVMPGIDLRLDAQVDNLYRLAEAGVIGDYPDVSINGGYQTEGNAAYSPSSAFILQSVIGTLRPSRILEVGSGFSTRAIIESLDFFGLETTQVTCVDPDFGRLGAAATDRRIRLIEGVAQDLNPRDFMGLGRGDIVFIDSTHVSKACSDVNWLLFECLPRLQPGVWVHIHDIFWPFEYPKSWLLDWGISWNEAYLVRGFLQFNQRFQIELFTTFLNSLPTRPIQKILPQCPGDNFGELWISSV